VTHGGGGARILLVDDDPAVLRGVGGLLRDEGYRTSQAQSVAEARASLEASRRDPPALILLDLRMPGEDGLSFLNTLAVAGGRPLPVPVVVLSGEASVSDAVQALKLGALDFVEKPPSPERLLTAVRNALALGALGEERERLRAELAKPGSLVGGSAAMDGLRRLVARVGPTDAVVLVTGETGSGKERVARALHLASGRKGRLVAVNCAAIPSQLLESELFGYERGAFSGAAARHVGRIEQAEGGTLLLDEIGDMPLDLQGKLLRVLEEREIERLGGAVPIPIDIRVVAATHRDLSRAVESGRFRQDLYYRLAVIPVAVPPLRSRPDDVLPLARAFAADLLGPSIGVTVTGEAETALRRYAWPGNVRELRNFVERVALLRDDEAGPLVMDVHQVAALTAGGGGAVAAAGGAAVSSKLTPAPALGDRSYRELIDDYERSLLHAALAHGGGNVAAAARLLRVDRGNLHRRIRALKIPMPSGEGESDDGAPTE